MKGPQGTVAARLVGWEHWVLSEPDSPCRTPTVSRTRVWDSHSSVPEAGCKGSLAQRCSSLIPPATATAPRHGRAFPGMRGHPKASSHARGEWDLLVALLNLLHGSFTLVEAPCGYGEGLILPLDGEDQHILPRTQVDAGGEPRHGMGRGQRTAGPAQGASRAGDSFWGKRSPPVPWGSSRMLGAPQLPSPRAASSPGVRIPELCLASERTLGNY